MLNRGSIGEELCCVYIPTNHLYLGDIVLISPKDVLRLNLSVREGIGITNSFVHDFCCLLDILIRWLKMKVGMSFLVLMCCRNCYFRRYVNTPTVNYNGTTNCSTRKDSPVRNAKTMKMSIQTMVIIFHFLFRGFLCPSNWLCNAMNTWLMFWIATTVVSNKVSQKKKVTGLKAAGSSVLLWSRN